MQNIRLNDKRLNNKHFKIVYPSSPENRTGTKLSQKECMQISQEIPQQLDNSITETNTS